MAFHEGEDFENNPDIVGEEDEAPEEDSKDTKPLDPFNPPSSLGPVVKENVMRFQGLIRAMIKILRNEAEKNIDVYRGQPRLKASDLLELPGIPDEGTNWGVYLGWVTKSDSMICPRCHPSTSFEGQHRDANLRSSEHCSTAAYFSLLKTL